MALADKAVQKVRENQKPETLPYLNARERRFIHLYIEQLQGVRTESVGDEEARRLIIFPQ